MDAKKIETYYSDQTFQVWGHLVSHAHFLLRCPVSNTQTENIDIVFNYTEYIETPTILRGLELTIANNQTAKQQFTERTGINFDGGLRLFTLRSMGKIFYLAANSVLIHTNTLPMFDTPLQAILGIQESAVGKYTNYLTSALVMV